MNETLLALVPAQTPPWFVPIFVVLVFLVVPLSLSSVSHLSGWALLARRFRLDGSFYGQSWGWQSGRFRGWYGYNNCLTLGANEQGFYMKVMLPFSLFHPPLLIPWTEITVETGKLIFGFYDTALLRLGRDEQVSLRVYGRSVDRLRRAAGQGWPNYAVENAVQGNTMRQAALSTARR